MGGVGGAVAVTKIKYRQSPKSTAVVGKGCVGGEKEVSGCVIIIVRVVMESVVVLGGLHTSVYCHMSCVVSMI